MQKQGISVHSSNNQPEVFPLKVTKTILLLVNLPAKYTVVLTAV
jgi:hypothetical protein